MEPDIRYLAYQYGEFAASTMISGVIHPDMQLSNIGWSNDAVMKFIDYADIIKIRIPEDLTTETLRRLSRSIFPLFDSFPDLKSKSYVRAGFIAEGGILADVILHECMKKGFGNFMFFEDGIVKMNEDYDVIKYIRTPVIEQAIREWKDFPVEKTLKYLDNLDHYNKSTIRNKISPFNLYFLDRFYFIRSYMEIPDDQYPVLLVNAGLSAFMQNKKYRAYGLLKKAMLLLNGQNQPLFKNCKNYFNKTVHTKKLNPEMRSFIDNHIDLDYFELTWVLDDFDLMSI